jgi:hypothetical protein
VSEAKNLAYARSAVDDVVGYNSKMFSSKGLSSVAVYLALLPLLLLTAFSTVAGDETEVQLSPTDNSWAVNRTTNVSTYAKESQRLFDTVDASAELSSSPPSAAAAATEALNNSAAASDATDVAFNVSASQSTTTDAANWIQLQQPTPFSPDGVNNMASESVDGSRSNSVESDTNKLVAMMEDELLSPSNSTSMTAAAETLDTTAAAARKSRDNFTYSHGTCTFLCRATVGAIYSS